MNNTKKTLSAFCAGVALIAASFWDSPASANIASKGDNGSEARPDKTEFQCLTEAIYFEARGEPTAGQVASPK